MVRIDLTLEGVVSDVINTIRQLAAVNVSSPAATSPTPMSNNPSVKRRAEPTAQPPVGGAAAVAENRWTVELARAL